MVIDVIVSNSSKAVDKAFSYAVPEELEPQMVIGRRIIVPFARGNREIEGFCIRIYRNKSAKGLKSVARFADTQPVFGEKLLETIEYMHERYLCSYYELINAVVPTGSKERVVKYVCGVEADNAGDIIGKRSKAQLRAYEFLCSHDVMPLAEVLKEVPTSRETIRALEKKGLAEIFEDISERDPFANVTVKPAKHFEPTDEQRAAIERITSASENGGGVFLLHGVTGSGKTEVFLQAIDRVLKQGKTALVLVPEISLTPQMVSRFLSRFDSRVAVIHSRLSKGERSDQWRRIYNGEADIVIGARSAVFAPLENIGVIIMDEEHSESYKSDMSPRYHAREIAIQRGKQYGAAVVLASATPLVESYYRAKTGEYTLLEMSRRVNEKGLPPIRIADMRNELASGNRSMFSRLLYREMKKNIESGEQTILFLNRRGFSTFVSCRSCGYTVQCPHCNISLTYHKFDNMLRCHYCGYMTRNYTKCPSCGSKYIRFFGGGTQRVEDEIHRIFPEATTIRMDIDTTGKKQSHEKLLKKFADEKTDVLVGTQMVAKGLDFENVTLVGAVSADTMLHMNDFRANERTFSMLEQVTGRAGRGQKPGRAVIQTYTPDAEAVRLVTTHDYIGFYNGEIELRRLMWYPPFSKMIVVLFSATEANVVERCAGYFKKLLGNLREIDSRVQVLGPAAASVSRINNRYRFRMIIKCGDDDAFNERLREAAKSCRKHKDYKDVIIVIDKNPTSVG